MQQQHTDTIWLERPKPSSGSIKGSHRGKNRRYSRSRQHSQRSIGTCLHVNFLHTFSLASPCMLFNLVACNLEAKCCFCDKRKRST